MKVDEICDAQLFVREWDTDEIKDTSPVFHHDGHQKLILVYIEMLNHTQGTLVANNSEAVEDSVANPEEFWSIQAVEGNGVVLDDAEMWHAVPRIMPTDESKPVSRALLRILGPRSKQTFQSEAFYKGVGDGMPLAIAKLTCSRCSRKKCLCVQADRMMMK